MFSISSVASLYATWFFVRSFLHRGWWLVAGLYLVVDAGLTPFQLVFVGTAQALTVVLAELPAGVFADAYSRKHSLIIAHALMGLGMLSTGLVLSFPALVVTQMIWGLSWTFSSGADVAWMTDELDEPEMTAQALVSAAKWGQLGSAAGVLAIGGVAWATSLSTAIVIAGIGMWVLGAVVMATFPETKFQRAPAGEILATSLVTLRKGFIRLRSHRILVHILVCTYLVNGADEAFVRLYAKHMVELGLPSSAQPIVWFTLLTIATLTISTVALSFVNKTLKYGAPYSRAYTIAAIVGACGFGLLAASMTFEVVVLAVLLVSGVAMAVMRTVSVVWTNENATSEVRATVQSFLSLAENLGELTLGFTLAIVANYAGIPAAMVGGCIILAFVVLNAELYTVREK